MNTRILLYTFYCSKTVYVLCLESIGGETGALQVIIEGQEQNIIHFLTFSDLLVEVG